MDYVCEADALESFRHQAYAAAVKGSIDYLQVCVLFNGFGGEHQ